MVFEHLEEKEAVEIAALIEKNGFAFYSILADKTKKKSIKAVFKKLAKDERRHLKILEDKYYPEAGFGEQITEEELAIEDYVSRAADPAIFTEEIDVKKLIEVIDSVKKAVQLAIHTERMHQNTLKAWLKRPPPKKVLQCIQSLPQRKWNMLKNLMPY